MLTLTDIKEKKKTGEKIVMLTAYDFGMASFIDQTQVDMILVGDSLGMVVLGYESTIPVTLEEMLHHCKAVKRGVKNTIIVGDMPFLTYHISPEDAIRNAGRFIKEGMCQAVKLEGGVNVAPTIERLTTAGIPVMAHIGLTPQTAANMGGFKVQGRDLESAKKLFEDAKAVTESGAFSLLLECIPTAISKAITETVSIPTIGIGAGPYCDGQVLVTNDILGTFEKFLPKFAKQYVNLAPEIKKALSDFVQDVRGNKFPDEQHSFGGGEEALKAILSPGD